MSENNINSDSDAPLNEETSLDNFNSGKEENKNLPPGINEEASLTNAPLNEETPSDDVNSDKEESKNLPPGINDEASLTNAPLNEETPSDNDDNFNSGKAENKNLPPGINEEASLTDAPLNEETPFDNVDNVNSGKEENKNLPPGINDEEASLTNNPAPGDSAGKTEPSPNIIPAKPKEGNYQISLINKDLLKVLVLTKRGVKINSSVTDAKTSTETQSNEIFLNPKPDSGMQEVEIMIEHEAIESHTEENPDPENTEEKINESIFMFDTVNENLLKVRLVTGGGVKIDSTARDKKTSTQTQSSRIYLQPKYAGELLGVEITISIEPEKEVHQDELKETEADGKIKLIPNPEVEDLIRPPDYSNLSVAQITDPYSEGNILYEGFNNPFDSIRKIIRKNLTIGIIAAVILHFALAGLAFYTISKNQKTLEPEEQSRLIVIQDLPDPKIKLEDVEDPNKPKVKEPEVKEPDINESKKEITPRKIVRPPIVTRPKRDTDDKSKLDSSLDAGLTRELDSVRKMLTENIGKDTTKIDTASADTTSSAFEIPDSLRNNFQENDIGLAMYYPKSWKLIDQREINKNEKTFKGVVITDTTAEQAGTMNLFISLDNENKDFKAEDFKTEFKMNDSTLRAYFMEPRTIAGTTSYRFYIFNNLGTEKLSVNAQVRKQFFDQYKNEIEAVVRSIRIKKKADL